jgi:putative ABC transport system substrate-binding protein
MRRRDVLAGFLATTAASALQAAEQNMVHRLAVCSSSMESFSTPPLVWLPDWLRQAGFAEGKNLIIDRYATEGRAERYAEVARKIVQGKPDVIALGFDHQFILEVANETSTIPIVATFGDPVAAGIIKNMARPERNITGVSLDAGDRDAREASRNTSAGSALGITHCLSFEPCRMGRRLGTGRQRRWPAV